MFIHKGNEALMWAVGNLRRDAMPLFSKITLNEHASSDNGIMLMFTMFTILV